MIVRNSAPSSRVHAPASVLLLSGLLPSALGCSDPLVERQDIADLRVLGARIEPHDDPSRATPYPGERASVRWLVAGPDGPIRVAYGLTSCASAASSRGVPTCVDEPVARLESEAPSHAPSLELTVPTGPRLLSSGVFCTSGGARLRDSLESSSCSDPAADFELASYEVPIGSADSGSAVNHHPDLTDAVLELDGAPWDAASPSAGDAGSAGAAGAAGSTGASDPCSSDEGPRVERGQTVSLTLRLPEEAREQRGEDEGFGAREVLQISHVSSAGSLSRAFTVLGPDDTELVANVTWRAPHHGGAAYVYFVVRDMRGGVSWLERHICVNE